LHYVFAGNGNTHPSATDYYLCRTLQPGSNIGDCSYADNGIVETRSGNRKLKDETSRSLTAGFVWSPLDNLDVSLDYFRIRLANEVLDMNIDSLLRQEADCRIGRTADGSAVDGGSPTCQDALARVTRNPADSAIAPNGLVGVRINPINVARESTSGYDFAGSYRLPTSIGTFRLRAAYTWVKDHTIQRYPGDPTIDQFAVDSGYDIPRSKASASLSWESGRWTATVHGQRLGPLPNYASTGFIGATYLYNGSLQYKLSDHAQIAFTVDNLLDKKPPRDPTYSSYPYYDVSWFDSEGRSYFVQITYKFGGGAL
jgi:outer membrane receptor protein involved in Fe transport